MRIVELVCMGGAAGSLIMAAFVLLNGRQDLYLGACTAAGICIFSQAVCGVIRAATKR